MKTIVMKFGLISGAILAALIASMVPATASGKMDFDYGELVGYAGMVLAFLAVFFGIRTYRERVAGGAISFGRAFRVGILITLISCAMYVVSWEIVYFNFIPDFADKYAAHQIETMRKKGLDAAKIEAETKKMAEFKALYANPVINSGITFLEVFPVGLVMTLLSAAILKRKTAPGPPAPAASPAG